MKSDLKIRSNPKNTMSQLFKTMTRLFSGPIVNYKRKLPARQRRTSMDKFKFDTPTGASFAKNRHNPLTILQSERLAEQGRVERYIDFEQMEYEPMIASALNTFADEMCSYSDLEKILRIECKNEQIKTILEDLYYNILNIESNLHSWARNMCKRGDFFLYIDVEDGKGITGTIAIPAEQIERLEGLDEDNPNYIQFQWNQGGLTFEYWQIAHFRILGNDKYTPYGSAVVDPVRRAFRQLILLEDAMMAYRVIRSTERRVFYLQVGNIPPDDVEQYVKKVAAEMKNRMIVDPTTSNVDKRYASISVEEDYIIPVRGDVSSRIETLAGGQYVGAIDDVKYLRDKVYTGLTIPSEYLTRGGEDSGAGDEKSLSQKDIKFAKIIQRLQKHLIEELRKMAVIHLHSLGFKGNDIIDFEIHLNNPSKLAELQYIDTLRMKLEIAVTAKESGFMSRRACAEGILGQTIQEHERNQIELFYDKKFDARLGAMEGKAEGGMGGEFGDELDSLPDSADFPPDETETPEAGDAAPEFEPGELLASPGNRAIGENGETAGAKGHEYVKTGGHTNRGHRQHHDAIAGMRGMSASQMLREMSDQRVMVDGILVSKGLIEEKKEREIGDIKNLLRDMRKCDNMVIESLMSEKKHQEVSSYVNDENVKQVESIQSMLQKIKNED